MPKPNIRRYQPKHQTNKSDFLANLYGHHGLENQSTMPMRDIFSSSALQQKSFKNKQSFSEYEERIPIHSRDTAAAKKSKKMRIVKIAVVTLSVLGLSAGSIFLYAESKLNQIHYQNDSEVSIAVASYITSAQVNSSAETNLGNIYMKNGLYHDDAIKNILLMGVDDYQKDDIGRSDSMMLISVDTRHKKLKMTSFLRDLYVDIPGCSEKNRINVAYSIGGAPLTMQTIESNFGIDIDHYVTIGYGSFSKIIDRLGGVPITVSAEEAKLVNWYSGESRSKDLKEGSNLLTGKQALYYSRIRAIGDDFGRTERQRKVFSSIIEKFKNSDFVTIDATLTDVSNLVFTNMSKSKVVDMAANSLTYMKYPVSQNRIPANNTYEAAKVTIGGIMGNEVIEADMKKNSLVASKFIYEDDFHFPSDDETGTNASSVKSD